MKTKLSALERLTRTLEFKEIDMVATGEIIQCSEIISRFAGRTVNNDWTIQEIAETYKGLEIDTGLLIAPAARPGIESRIGLKYEVTYWSEWIIERPFRDVDGLKKYVKWMIGEVKNSEPQCQWSYAGKGAIVGQEINNYKAYFDNLKRILGGITIPAHIESPVGLDTMYNIAGFDLLTYLYLDDPGLVLEWFEVLNLHEIARVHLVAEREISPFAVVYCDIASNSGPIFSPEFYRDFFFEGLKKLTDAWHDHGIKVIFHSEGNLKLLIDDIVRCGIDGINPCEKRNMSVDFVRKNYPELLIWGGIDQFELLPNGTVQEVVAEVKRVLEVCSNGGYILGADGQVHPSCKADNVIAMFKAAKKQL